ncbi:MAG: hypothetical protein Q4G08_07460 [Capnocytophaga sp.]|nr:hypothetical protein [Capnocytophaga sp.]
MTDEIKQKLAKVYELVRRGEQGEQQAAEKALKRLVEKYNITDDELSKIQLKNYAFKYASELDKRLLLQLFTYFFGEKYNKFYSNTWHAKEIEINMEYLDYIQIETAYGYFKPHMNKEWRKHGLPQLTRFRKAKNKNARRKELQDAFFSKYVLNSGIYHEHQVEQIDFKDSKEVANYALFNGVEGGALRNQVTTGLYLEQ